MKRRVTTGVIRLETLEPNAYVHPDLNPTYYFSWMYITEGRGIGRRAWHFYRWNFTLNQADAYRV